MARFLLILVPLALAGCVVVPPELPGGPSDDPRWYDSRVALEASSASAPDCIPDVRLDRQEQRAIALSARELILLRDATQSDPRAEAPQDNNVDDFASEARDSTRPPD